MLDSSSNTSFISKNVVKKLGIRGPKTHLTMNFTEGQKKLEASEFLDITVVSNTEPSIQKSVRAYAINKPCSPARTISRTTLESYPHLKAFSDDLHLSGGTVDLPIMICKLSQGNPENQLQRKIASGRGTSWEHLIPSRVNNPLLSIQMMWELSMWYKTWRKLLT